jgi:hypothetical protein
MAGLGAYTAGTVVPKEGDLDKVGTLVDKSAAIQAAYSKCTDEDSKRKIAMEYHTSMRSFHEVAFCCAGVKEEWKAAVKGGLVFSLAVVQTLWSANQFPFGHIENKRMFQETQPYHPQQLKLGKRFEIYLQAFRVRNEDNFLQEAELLYLALDKKRKPEWDTMLPMFTAFLKGKSFYYVGRSIKGGFWRYWSTKKAARAQMDASGYAKQTVVGIMQALVDKEVVQHKSVVLWRAKKAEKVTPFL